MNIRTMHLVVNVRADSWLKAQTKLRVTHAMPVFIIAYGSTASCRRRFLQSYFNQIIEWQHELSEQGHLEFDHVKYDSSKATFTNRNKFVGTYRTTLSRLVRALDLPPEKTMGRFWKDFDKMKQKVARSNTDDQLSLAQGDAYGTPEFIELPHGFSKEMRQVITDAVTQGRISFKHIGISIPEGPGKYPRGIPFSMLALDPILVRVRTSISGEFLHAIPQVTIR